MYLRRLMGEKTILEVPQEIEEELNQARNYGAGKFSMPFLIFLVVK